jgi:hypothetical protein
MNIKELLRRHAELDLRITALEESITLINAEFSSRDGVPPNKLVITGDGKRVPPHMFSELCQEFRERHLQPLYDERNKLEEIDLNG